MNCHGTTEDFVSSAQHHILIFLYFTFGYKIIFKGVVCLRVLVSGGGTGGHVNPAIAIANYIKEKDKKAQIAFVGTEKGIENILVPKEGYKLYHVKVKGFKRKQLISLSNIDALIKAFTSQMEAKKIIKEFKPDIVIGTGGYVSFPILAAAAKMKIPTVIHEQNAFPGVTTKTLAKNVDKVMISFEDSRKYFSDQSKLIYTGNPVKSEFFNLDYAKAKSELTPGRPMIMSYGGSMGAEPINEAVIEFMDKYSKNKNINHYHATGSRVFKETSDVFNQKGLNTYKNLFLSEYFYGISKYIAAADIIICRSGALTLAELSIAGKAAILIPSPYVTENHQYKNAEVLERENAAVIIEEKDLTAELLMKKVDELLSDPVKLANMSKNIGKFAIRDTLEKMYKIIVDCKAGK